jgi:hypothetical protein
MIDMMSLHWQSKNSGAEVFIFKCEDIFGDWGNRIVPSNEGVIIQVEKLEVGDEPVEDVERCSNMAFCNE